MRSQWHHAVRCCCQHQEPAWQWTVFQCDAFQYQPETDMYFCPGEKTLKRKARFKKDKSILYPANAKDCGCSLKQRCTASSARRVSRHMFEDALTRMNDASMLLMGSGHGNALYMFFRSYKYTSAPGAIINGVTAAFDDEDGITFNEGFAVSGKDEDWR